MTLIPCHTKYKFIFDVNFKSLLQMTLYFVVLQFKIGNNRRSYSYATFYCLVESSHSLEKQINREDIFWIEMNMISKERVKVLYMIYASKFNLQLRFLYVNVFLCFDFTK